MRITSFTFLITVLFSSCDQQESARSQMYRTLLAFDKQEVISYDAIFYSEQMEISSQDTFACVLVKDTANGTTGWNYQFTGGGGNYIYNGQTFLNAIQRDSLLLIKNNPGREEVESNLLMLFSPYAFRNTIETLVENKAIAIEILKDSVIDKTDYDQFTYELFDQWIKADGGIISAPGFNQKFKLVVQHESKLPAYMETINSDGSKVWCSFYNYRLLPKDGLSLPTKDDFPAFYQRLDFDEYIRNLQDITEDIELDFAE